MKTFVLNGWSASEHAWDLCLFPRERIFSYVEQLDGKPEEAMRAERDGVVLVGWSMGGSGALRLAMKFPEKIKGLVLIATTARMMKAPNWAGMSDRRLAALAIIGQISPLIGLLGTVIGFIKTVMLVNSQPLVSRADLLGASMDALVSAAMGLVVAIPVVVMYGSLCVRMDRISTEMEAAASHVVGYFAARKEKERK